MDKFKLISDELVKFPSERLCCQECKKEIAQAQLDSCEKQYQERLSELTLLTDEEIKRIDTYPFIRAGVVCFREYAKAVAQAQLDKGILNPTSSQGGK